MTDDIRLVPLTAHERMVLVTLCRGLVFPSLWEPGSDAPNTLREIERKLL